MAKKIKIVCIVTSIKKNLKNNDIENVSLSVVLLYD